MIYVIDLLLMTFSFRILIKIILKLIGIIIHILNRKKDEQVRIWFIDMYTILQNVPGVHFTIKR